MHRAHQVHVHHQLKVGQFHLGEGFVTQDAGVVDQNIDPAPGLYRLLHHGLHGHKVGHRGAIGQGLATGGTNFIHHRLCCGN